MRAQLLAFSAAALIFPLTVFAQEAATAERETPVATETANVETPAAANQAAAPVDPSGSWAWERDFGGNSMRITLKLDWDGEKLTGEHEAFDQKNPIKDAKYDGGVLSFTVEPEFNGNSFAVEFEGKPTGDEIAGTIAADFNGDTREWDWSAKRYLAPADVVGVWNLEVETPRGRTFEPSVKIEEKDGELTAVYTSRFGDQDAKYVKIEDGKLVFEVSGEGPRGSFKSVYTGSVRGGKIEGTNEFAFGDRTGEFEFTGEREKPSEEAANGEG